ncbi:unnamed protein product [Prunus armeniaca]|uniref:Uncharacterized protein n=1 Tax=Prunus armeniaca TaxID=36596 RepID=A0A6J5VCN3_PRUAR|nr:unnamed protein product [Prunus armeniaca]
MIITSSVLPGCNVTFMIDSDHFSSGGHVEGVVLTEASIAGSKSRTTAASLLRNCWIQASKELGIDVLHDEMSEHQDLSVDKLICLSKLGNKPILAAEASFSGFPEYSKSDSQRKRLGSFRNCCNYCLRLEDAVRGELEKLFLDEVIANLVLRISVHSIQNIKAMFGGMDWTKLFQLKWTTILAIVWWA